MAKEKPQTPSKTPSSIEPGFGWIDAARLVKASWNYKLDSPELKEKLKANIKRNGLIENIIVRELETGFFEIVNGNHRMDAVSELEIEKLFCFNLGSVSQAQAMRVAIETNETRFTSDQEQMAARIREIIEVFDRQEFISTVPFTDEQLDQILKGIEQATSPEDFKEVDENIETEHTCPKCGYAWSGGK